jgi:hypothetical protein
MGSDRSPRSRLVVIVIIVMAIGLSAALSYFMHLRSVELGRDLDSSDPIVVRDGLITLNERHDPVAIDKATDLLKSNNAGVWTNAAIYLGGLGKENSVPYLIKAMRHVENDRKDEIVSDLTAITGQSLGGNANAWRDWWITQHPTGSFRFDSSQTFPTASPEHPDSATQAGP